MRLMLVVEVERNITLSNFDLHEVSSCVSEAVVMV